MYGKMNTLSGSDDLYTVQTENRHLKDTIYVLRKALDDLKMSNQEAIRKAVSNATDEIAQLKATVNALHERMAAMKFEEAEKIQTVQDAMNYIKANS